MTRVPSEEYLAKLVDWRIEYWYTLNIKILYFDTLFGIIDSFSKFKSIIFVLNNSAVVPCRGPMILPKTTKVLTPFVSRLIRVDEV